VKTVAASFVGTLAALALAAVVRNELELRALERGLQLALEDFRERLRLEREAWALLAAPCASSRRRRWRA
jgi:hypothetical protein